MDVPERKLDREVKDEEDVIKHANMKNISVNSSDEYATEEIIYTRKRIDDQSDKDQKQMEFSSDKMMSTDVSQTVCTGNDVLEMREVQASVPDNTAATKDAQIDTNKGVTSSLGANEIGSAEEDLQYINTSIEHRQGKALQATLSKVDDIVTRDSQIAEHFKDRLTYSRNITVQTNSNKNPISFTGCAVLNRSTVLLADYNNRKLIVVDTQSEVVTEEKSLNSDPWDIAVLPGEQVAVTLPFEKEILVLSTTGKLSHIRNVKVKGECYGITYGKGKIYVVCCNPVCVLSMDVKGKHQKNIFQNSRTYRNHKVLHCCVLSDELSTIYISSYASHSVIRLTLKGEILSVIEHDELEEPEGIALLDDGSLLVCSYGKNAILRISGDLKQCRMITRVDNPQSVCYNHHNHEVYVGTFNNEQLQVFRKQ